MAQVRPIKRLAPQKQMHMRIDEPGRDYALAAVDDQSIPVG